MVLEAIPADEAHQLLQLGNVYNGARAERLQRSVGQLSFANVSPYAALSIVCRDSAEGDRPLRRAARERAVRILLAEGRAEDGSGRDRDVRQKRFGPIAAVDEHALVGIVAVIVVPVHKGTRSAGGELQRV